jgi:hypothetical protein
MKHLLSMKLGAALFAVLAVGGGTTLVLAAAHTTTGAATVTVATTTTSIPPTAVGAPTTTTTDPTTDPSTTTTTSLVETGAPTKTPGTIPTTTTVPPVATTTTTTVPQCPDNPKNSKLFSVTYGALPWVQIDVQLGCSASYSWTATGISATDGEEIAMIGNGFRSAGPPGDQPALPPIIIPISGTSGNGTITGQPGWLGTPVRTGVANAAAISVGPDLPAGWSLTVSGYGVSMAASLGTVVGTFPPWPTPR